MITDYSINKKHPDAIVYIDANGCHFNLTVNDFASEEEFQRWKNWSDENYREQRNEQVQYEKHTLPESALNDDSIQLAGAEDEILRMEELEECHALIEKIRNHVTPTQFRRMMLRFIEGKSMNEIGELEGISSQAAGRAIRAGVKRAKKTTA